MEEDKCTNPEWPFDQRFKDAAVAGTSPGRHSVPTLPTGAITHWHHLRDISLKSC